MNRKNTPVLLSLIILLLGGCTTILIRDVGITGMPRMTTQQIADAGLNTVQDKVFISFLDDCPAGADAPVPQCNPPIGQAICRGPGKTIQFQALSRPGPSHEFGIAFPPGFNPCNGDPDLSIPDMSTKTCVIKPQAEWPGGGVADIIIKYTVVSASGTCDLDPYLVLTR